MNWNFASKTYFDKTDINGAYGAIKLKFQTQISDFIEYMEQSLTTPCPQNIHLKQRIRNFTYGSYNIEK